MFSKVFCITKLTENDIKLIQPQATMVNKSVQPQEKSLEAKIKELKELKDAGLIDDAMYKRAVEKLL